VTRQRAKACLEQLGRSFELVRGAWLRVLHSAVLELVHLVNGGKLFVEGTEVICYRFDVVSVGFALCEFFLAKGRKKVSLLR